MPFVCFVLLLVHLFRMILIVLFHIPRTHNKTHTHKHKSILPTFAASINTQIMNVYYSVFQWVAIWAIHSFAAKKNYMNKQQCYFNVADGRQIVFIVVLGVTILFYSLPKSSFSFRLHQFVHNNYINNRNIYDKVFVIRWDESRFFSEVQKVCNDKIRKCCQGLELV